MQMNTKGLFLGESSHMLECYQPLYISPEINPMSQNNTECVTFCSSSHMVPKQTGMFSSGFHYLECAKPYYSYLLMRKLFKEQRNHK